LRREINTTLYRRKNKNVSDNSKSFQLKICAAPEKVYVHENHRLK